MLMLLKESSEFESVLDLILLRFAIVAAIIVVIAIVLFALALWLHRRGSLGGAMRYVAPLARSAASYRRRRRFGRDDLMSAGLTALARTVEEHRDDVTSHSRRGVTHVDDVDTVDVEPSTDGRQR